MQRLLQYLVYEIFWIHISVSVKTQWLCVHHINNIQASAVRMTKLELFSCMCTCQIVSMTKWQMLFLYLKKKKIVVYKVFKFLLCRSIFKLIGRYLYSYKLWSVSVQPDGVTEQWKSEFSENTEGTDSSLLCLESIINL